MYHSNQNLHKKYFFKKIIPTCLIKTDNKVFIVSKNANKKSIQMYLAASKFCEMYLVVQPL